MPLIEIENVSKIYSTRDASSYAVRSVSLEINEGEFVTVMGPSGSGKSTFLTIVGGLNAPTEGRITVDEIDIYSLRGDRLSDLRREYVGFVFQSFHLVPYLNVIENVVLPLAPTELSSRLQQQAAEPLLDQLGLSDKVTHLPGELSGGEQQRVAIARALINEPLILLADEPTGNLDTVTSEAIMKLFKSFNEQGKTIVMVTHNPEYRSYSSRTIDFRDGVVVNDNVGDPPGSTASISSQEVRSEL